MPGIVMSKKQKMQIFEFLHKIGIEKLESFVFNPRDKESVKAMIKKGYEYHTLLKLSYFDFKI